MRLAIETQKTIPSLVTSSFHSLKFVYRIYFNKRRGPFLIFRTTSATLILGQRLFEGGNYLNIVPNKYTVFYIFIQRYTFYLLIFLWTDTKLIVSLGLLEKFMR